MALPPAATSISGTLTPCVGDTITYTASAPAPTSTQAPVALYKWTIPANTTILSAANDSSYIVLKFNTGYVGGSISVRTASAIGMLSTLTYKITLKYAVATPTSITSSTGSANACIGQTITYTAVMPTLTSVQAPAVKYIWTKPNYTNIIGSADSPTITLAFTTGYTGGSLSVKGQSACGVLGTAKLYVLTHTGCATGTKMSTNNNIQNDNSAGDFILYPNPTSNEFNLFINTKSSEPVTINILDMQGRVIKNMETNISSRFGKDLKPGIYLFEINQGKIRKTIKAIKL